MSQQLTPARANRRKGVTRQRPQWRRHTISALTGTLAFAALPALATAPATAGVTIGENITAFPNRDMVVAVGYQAGETLDVRVIRNGVVIGQTSGPAVSTPEGVGLEVNHGPLGDALPGDCWNGVTPNILGGDVIEVTTPRGVDTMTVTNLDFTGDPQVGPSGEVFVEGQASTADGTRLAAGAFIVEFRRDKPEPRFRRGPFNPVYQGDTGTLWRATFTPSTTTSSEGLTTEQQRDIALNEASWMAVADRITETTIAEHGEGGGPAAGCESAPAEPNAIASGYESPINIASGDMVLSGTAREGVVNVSITVGSLAPKDAVLSANTTGVKTWTLTVPKAELETLPDGNVILASSFDGLAGASRTVLKDMVAPLAPTASPGSGTYAGTQNVALNKPAGEQLSKVYWEIGTANVPDPDRFSNAYATQIAVSSSQTIKARVIDPAGNPGAVAAFDYKIGTPTAAPTNVTATEGAGSARVSWTAVTGAVGYNVYRDGATTPVNSTPVTGTSLTDSPLAEGTHTYVVRALESNGVESAASAPATVTLAAPAVPRGLTATAGDARVTLGWTGNTETDIAGYRIYRDGAATALATTAESARSYVDTGLTNGTTYTYAISAVDDAGNESGRTGVVQGTPTAAASVAPAAPSVSPASGSYTTAQSVTMAAATGTTIRYTVGTGTTVPADPTATTGTVYSGPVSVSASSIVKAIAVNSSGQTSPVTRRDYTISTGTSTPTTRTVTLVAAADTMVRQGSPTATAGAATTLSVDNDMTAGNTSTRATSYARFNIPALTTGETITAASLSLHATNSTTNGPEIWRTATSWNEGTMSWNTGQPARMGTAAVGNFATMATGRSAAPVTGITTSGLVSFQLYSESTDNLVFASSEHGTTNNRPRLILTITQQ